MVISVRTLVVGVLVSCATFARSQPVEWKDQSPHTAAMIPVEDDVQLEACPRALIGAIRGLRIRTPRRGCCARD